MNILAIDPGMSGAVAILHRDVIPEPAVMDMPVHELTVGGKKKRRIDVHQLCENIRPHLPIIDHAVIEHVGAMPGQGVTSSFAFGEAFGLVHGIVVALGIPLTLARPVVWKRAMGVTADKDSSRLMASRLYPGHAHLWSRVKDDGRAEAVLLATWYLRSVKQAADNSIFS